MSIWRIIEALLAVTIAILVLAIRSLKKSLKQSQKDLESAQAQVITKTNELEVIRDVQQKLKTSKAKTKPKSTEAISSGDSTSRLNRLNQLSNSTSKN